MSRVPPRRAAGTIFATTVAAIACAHTLLRDDRWAYEWTWAMFQYQFVVVLLAPVVAAAAAWEAVAGRSSIDAATASGRGTAVALALVARLGRWTLLGAAIGMAPVLAAVWRARGVEAPPLTAWVGMAPAASQLGAIALASYALARAWPRVAVVPLAAVGWFGLVIGANVVGPEPLVRIGGASASLLGLHVSRSALLLQVAGATALAAVALAIIRAVALPTVPAGRRWAPAIAALGALTATIVAAGQVGPLFARHDLERTCIGHEPTWCLATPYLAARDELVAATRPAFAEVRALGLEPPARIVQGQPGNPIVEDLLHGGDALRPFAVVYAWLPGDCTVRARSALLDDLNRWVDYLGARLDGSRPQAEGIEAEDLRRASARIRACEQA